MLISHLSVKLLHYKMALRNFCSISTNIRYPFSETLTKHFPAKLSRKLFICLLLSSIVMSLLRMPQVQKAGRKANVTILLWYWPFLTAYSLEGDVCLQKYNISGCQLGDNHILYDEADIVVFHHHELMLHKQKLPHHFPRPNHKRWLFMSLEAPENNENFRQYEGIFNLTLSYRPDADISVPYGKLVHKEKDGYLVHPRNKTDLVCWVVSNYRMKHKRTKVYLELRKTIPIQLYGRSVKKPLTQNALLPTISRCYFYLAFENVESRHYITEKLWRNAFMAGAVPVVLGPPRSDYEAVAPPHSFIHVNDFQSVAALGQFLTELANDEKRYMSYFAWHQNYSVKLCTDWRERLCNICPVYDKLPSHQIHYKLNRQLN